MQTFLQQRVLMGGMEKIVNKDVMGTVNGILSLSHDW